MSHIQYALMFIGFALWFYAGYKVGVKKQPKSKGYDLIKSQPIYHPKLKMWYYFSIYDTHYDIIGNDCNETIPMIYVGILEQEKKETAMFHFCLPMDDCINKKISETKSHIDVYIQNHPEKFNQ
jgi:hypothetical protein